MHNNDHIDHAEYLKRTSLHPSKNNVTQKKVDFNFAKTPSQKHFPPQLMENVFSHQEFSPHSIQVHQPHEVLRRSVDRRNQPKSYRVIPHP